MDLDFDFDYCKRLGNLAAEAAEAFAALQNLALVVDYFGIDCFDSGWMPADS